MNIDDGVEEDGLSFNHTGLFSERVHGELNDSDCDRDCLGSDTEGFKRDQDSSNDELKGIILRQHVSRWQAWRARVAALKVIYEDEIEQFSRILNFSTEVVETNPDTKCLVKTIENDEAKKVFQRWYLCWTECREGFKSWCRRIIGVDGCHLKTKRGRQLLLAIRIDPNNNILPLTYACVEVESKDSWEWFLTHLFEDIRSGQDYDEQLE
ncbi:hypothetical protein LIER_12053 [Lithospermum erythrorhizon]|uniref:MULE transposase domain-containing protein n=1 Tax=Lithospermum erythrorhizon TaxID=34254 RepID=A0AAV3PSP7_LITER